MRSIRRYASRASASENVARFAPARAGSDSTVMSDLLGASAPRLVLVADLDPVGTRRAQHPVGAERVGSRADPEALVGQVVDIGADRHVVARQGPVDRGVRLEVADLIIVRLASDWVIGLALRRILA